MQNQEKMPSEGVRAEQQSDVDAQSIDWEGDEKQGHKDGSEQCEVLCVELICSSTLHR